MAPRPPTTKDRKNRYVPPHSHGMCVERKRKLNSLASQEQVQGNARGLFGLLCPPDSNKDESGAVVLPSLAGAVVGETETASPRSLFERITPPRESSQKTENRTKTKPRKVFDDVAPVSFKDPNGEAFNQFVATVCARDSADQPFDRTATATTSSLPDPKLGAAAANIHCPARTNANYQTNTTTITPAPLSLRAEGTTMSTRVDSHDHETT